MVRLIILFILLSFPTISFANPFANITYDQAKTDCLYHLKKQYKSNFSTIKFLLKSNMEAFDKLHALPAEDENIDLILSRLLATYYPSFSAIYNLYEKEYEAMKEIEGI